MVNVHADVAQVEAGNGFAARGTEYPHILGMDVTRCRAGAVGRWGDHTSSHVQECPAVGQTEDTMVTAGPVTILPSASGLFVALLDYYPCVRALRQVSLAITMPTKY